MENIQINFLERKIAEEFQKNKWKVKTLEEISNNNIFLGDSKITIDCQHKGNFPAIINEDISSANIYINTCKVFVNKFFYKREIFIEKGDLLIIASGFSSEKLGKSCVYLGDEKCMIGNHVTAIKHSQNPKYLAYMMSTEYVKRQIKKLCKGNSRARINKNDLKKITVLIPDLETQNKIVKFLDNFLNLKKESELEITKRNKQYEYYKELISNVGI